jgi:hypothetical protein
MPLQAHKRQGRRRDGDTILVGPILVSGHDEIIKLCSTPPASSSDAAYISQEREPPSHLKRLDAPNRMETVNHRVWNSL